MPSPNPSGRRQQDDSKLESLHQRNARRFFVDTLDDIYSTSSRVVSLGGVSPRCMPVEGEEPLQLWTTMTQSEWNIWE